MTMLDDDTSPWRKWHSGFGGFLLRDWPYVLMLLLSLGGVAYTSFTQTEMYWILLTPLFGLVCVITRWPQVEGREERMHLLVSQGLHWAAVLVAMELMSLQVLRQVTGIASPLSVLTLLALGTFTAGLLIRSWKVCAVGAILGVSVPAVALLQQSALLILLIIAVLVAIAVPFIWARSREPVSPARPLYEPSAAEPIVTSEPAVPEPPAAPVSQTPLFEQPFEAAPVAPDPAPQPASAEPVPSQNRPAPMAVVDDGREPIRDSEKSDTSASDGEPPHDNVRNILGGR
ncbi:conserved hypothetical protein [Rhodopseudomonas palustris BisB5]|uniref:Uncharacterized protein n=1 Tax=Rhodopseudomonas palustris (strain BisB5) TaxID=316057 RepID=Q139X9_RHOPS|nr:conserved hypothetical protein [Rhodopseudomonas palustris BisB5]